MYKITDETSPSVELYCKINGKSFVKILGNVKDSAVDAALRDFSAEMSEKEGAPVDNAYSIKKYYKKGIRQDELENAVRKYNNLDGAAIVWAYDEDPAKQSILCGNDLGMVIETDAPLYMFSIFPNQLHLFQHGIACHDPDITVANLMDKLEEANRYKCPEEYDSSNHAVRMSICLHAENDKDIIEAIGDSSKQTKIKELIRKALQEK